MDYIFENYEAFINDKSNEIGSPAGAMRMLNDEGMFEGFVDTLIDRYPSNVQPMLKALCERQREMIITEMANVPGSAFAPGWTVLSFPILVDIYSEPILAELCNVYPVQKPLISVPRLRIKAQTRSYDGREIQETFIPTATKSVRSGVVEVNITPRTTTNIFTNSGMDPAHMKMNRQYTLMTTVHVIERDANNTDPATNIRSEQDVEVNFRPDNRAHFNHSFDMLDAAKETVTGDVSGNLNYEKGTVQYQVIFTGGTSDSVYECSYATMSLRFVPNATMNGRTKVSLEIEMTDLTIDPNEDKL